MCPRGIPIKNKKVSESPKNESEARLDTEIVSNLVEAIISLKEEIQALREERKAKVEAETIKPDVVIEGEALVSEPLPTDDSTQTTVYPVPMEYRMLVDQQLGKEFEIEINPSPDLPQFEFTIIVPSKLSNSQDKTIKDRRSKMISYSEGINAVKEWVEKIRLNVTKKQNETLQI